MCDIAHMIPRIFSYVKCKHLPCKSRLTVVSCEAKKKQAIHDEQVSYLHVAPLKFVNALNKPPLKLSLSYQGLSMLLYVTVSAKTSLVCTKI